MNQYNVSFNSSGGTEVADVAVNHGATLSAPTAPSRTGYTFTGWYTDADRTQLFNFAGTVITGNIQLYAGWSINQYSVSFNSGGGTAVADVPVTYGSTISAPTAPTRTGYRFTSWYSDAALTQTLRFCEYSDHDKYTTICGLEYQSVHRQL
ncbi:InlB B-repeat-containing protein [Paenibacillus amylolyticus]|nr:InlB B-repeat-containing protein [Paenibacillus amylolyticus]WFR63083.1 InlB B-repeat-containing protein [Paenibacillus amylolyticus]